MKLPKPDPETLAAARRIWFDAALPGDVELVKAWLAARFPKPPTRTDYSVRWVLACECHDAPSRYANLESFIARGKQAPHLNLGEYWPAKS